MFNYKILHFHSVANIWDRLFIELYDKGFKNHSKSIELGNIYGPLTKSYWKLCRKKNEIFSTLQRYRSEVIIEGDFNLDLLKKQTNEHIKTIFDSMLSNSFIPKITFPTRLTNQSGTLN